jgi:hypothetical protein
MSKRPEIVVPPRCLSVLHQNPFYDHYIRHKTHTSLQNKLNGGSSPSSSPSSSENKSSGSNTKAYSRVIYPQSSLSNSSSTPGTRCYNGMKHILDDHANLAQTVTVR